MATRTVLERSRAVLSAISYGYVNFSSRAMGQKMMDFSKLTRSQLENFKNRYDAYIFDLDNTLITLEKGPYEGAVEVLEEIKKNRKCIMILSDNCMHTLKSLSEKINSLFPTVNKENVMNSGFLMVNYLKEINFNKKIYAVGTKNGVIAELKENGFDVLHDEEMRKTSIEELRETKFEKDVAAVMLGTDLNFTYFKMFKATNYLFNPEVMLLQTHFPVAVQSSPVLLGAGAITACVKAVSGRTKSICVGKGSEYCTKYLNSLGFEAQRCLLIGDDLKSDMKAGNLSGMDTMFVLTGYSTLEMAQQAKEKNLVNMIPTYYTKSVADMIKIFKTEK